MKNELTDRSINIIKEMLNQVNVGEKSYIFTCEDVRDMIMQKNHTLKLPTRHAIIAVKFAIGERAQVGAKHEDLKDLLHELDRINSYLNEPEREYEEVLEIKRDGNEQLFGNADGKIISVRKTDATGKLNRVRILIKLV
jgi:hypothetical protein